MQSIPKRGRKGDVIYSETRHGKVARSYVAPANPRTQQQQDHRKNVRAVSARWSSLTREQCDAWRAVAARKWFISDEGELVRRNLYNLFVSLNVRRADLGLPQFDSPPPQPEFPQNPAEELIGTLTEGRFSLKLRAKSLRAQHTLVYAAAPVGSGVRHVNHFRFLTLLPPSENGLSDLTAPYVARYGMPKPNQAIWIRVCQHIDGWIDTPKVLRTRLATANS